MLTYQDSIKSKFPEEPNREIEITRLDMQQVWSYAFATYVFMLVSIDAARVFSDELNNDNVLLNQYRIDWRERIKRIVDIANDIVKHPLGSKNGNGYAYSPNSIERSGNFDVYKWSFEKNDFEIVSIDVFQDIKITRDYLRGIMQIWFEIMPNP